MARFRETTHQLDTTAKKTSTPITMLFRRTNHGKPLQVPLGSLLDQRGICVSLIHGMQDQSGASEQR